MLRLQNKRQAEKSKVEAQAAKKPTPQAPSIAQIAAGQETAFNFFSKIKKKIS